MLARLSKTIHRTLPRRTPFPNPIRTYLGDAGPMQKSPNAAAAAREQALWEKAQPRYDSIMERHIRLPTGGNAESDEQLLEVRKKRLIYRSKQRGWLEVDLLLGTWAAQNVPNLTLEELDQFEEFVNLETIDIYNVLTLRVDVPEEMRGKDSVVERIREWAKDSPLGKADKERYGLVKKMNNLI
ncbi:hypothetical protein ACHAWO_009436 [Cyclotella atomus]|uniref:Succinate dehydrogenase assembly factor 2, mitochondrial n=1 Tax=Cyclotella atomus TaxID=382360 RepID=A0ABD3MN86_9STRA